MTNDEQAAREAERLEREHRELDAQISALEKRQPRTPALDQELRQLKRLKLWKKDRLAALSRSEKAP